MKGRPPDPWPPVIDAHHHVWRLAETPWLSGPVVPRIFGDYSAIRRDYLIGEYAADATPHGVVGSVHVQANVAVGHELDEAQWAADTGHQVGLVQAVVAYADLTSPDLAARLDQLTAVPVVRGIRQQLHWHPNHAYRYAPVPDLMLDRCRQAGLREVSRRRLLFELQVFPGQYADTITMLDAFPDTTFVLLHTGMPADRSPDGGNVWRRGMSELAARPNVWVKLSGLGTFTRRCRLNEWQPIIETTVDVFGPHRCMFGSNFPIEKLWTSYDVLIGVVRASLRHYEPAEQRQILHDVAARIYHIDTTMPAS